MCARFMSLMKVHVVASKAISHNVVCPCQPASCERLGNCSKVSVTDDHNGRCEQANSHPRRDQGYRLLLRFVRENRLTGTSEKPPTHEPHA